MFQLLRKVIYTPVINAFLRKCQRLLGNSLPDKYRLTPNGKVRLAIEDTTILLHTNPTSYVVRKLYWQGAMRFEYTSIFVSLSRKVGSFWDIGANIGYYSVLGARLNTGLQVNAFEPSTGPHHYCQLNIDGNHLSDQIHLHNLALSNVQGQIDFYQVANPKFTQYHNLSGEHNTGSKLHLKAEKVVVKSQTLDAMRVTQPSIDLIKLDVEGAEVSVLQGAMKTLVQDKPIVICEVLFNYNEQEIDEIMSSLGYHFFAFQKGALKRITTLIRSEDDGVRMSFLYPRRR